MSNLTAFNQDGIEIYIDNNTGESFASISGYARMSGKSRQAISKRCSNQNQFKSAEILTPNGLRHATLISEDVIVNWLSEDNPELAKKMLKLGVRVFLHQLAGFTVKSNAIEIKTPTTYLAALKALVIAEEEKEKLQQEAKMLIEENEELNEFKNEVSEWDRFIELLDITKNEVSDDDYPEGISVYEYLIAHNNNSDNTPIDPELWSTISKRSSSYFRLLEGRHPDKFKNRNIFAGKKIAYILATIQLVQTGI